jgi:hypothetical protein
MSRQTLRKVGRNPFDAMVDDGLPESIPAPSEVGELRSARARLQSWHFELRTLAAEARASGDPIAASRWDAWAQQLSDQIENLEP